MNQDKCSMILQDKSILMCLWLGLIQIRNYDHDPDLDVLGGGW